MINNVSTIALIEKRYSCRSYQTEPIPQPLLTNIREMLAALPQGPFGTGARFMLISADEDDRQALKGLTTYGFIRNPTGFIVGAASDAPFGLEDFAYRLEYAVLYVTSLDLGTVWLGGTFNKGRFAQRMQLASGEELPAVIALGLIADKPRAIDALMRRQVQASKRKPWEELFFIEDFDTPINREKAGNYARVLDMTQAAPSASNKQPWRIIKESNKWHFYLSRNRIYKPRTTGLVGISDMQRIDMGIAMCHFALSAEELALPGHWEVRTPALVVPDALMEYTVSWISEP